jgi:hypothetical protein
MKSNSKQASDEIDAVNRTTDHDQRIGFARVGHGFFQAFWVFGWSLNFNASTGTNFLANFVATFRI